MTKDKTQVLSAEQVKLLERAQAGDLPCPQCGKPLRGGFVGLAGFFVGVLLYCTRCSFLEPSSAPARNCEARGVTTRGLPSRKAIELEPEDILPAKEAELLQKAKKGVLPCPWCDGPLRGEFVCFTMEGDDFYAGVRLSCLCGFVEY